jgi:AraC-like DNA-binding protein
MIIAEKPVATLDGIQPQITDGVHRVARRYDKGIWCQRARIAVAIERLSMDASVSVKQIASDLGYASVPAFSHAFRQVTGKTPTQFSGKGQAAHPTRGRREGRSTARDARR